MLRAIPIRTHIIRPGEDLLEVVRRYLPSDRQEDDLLVLSSKAVSIAQGRLLRPTDVEPCRTALVLSRFFPEDGSLSSPFSMQAVMREEGYLRVVAAFVLGGISRVLLRRSGDFYQLAGINARVVDDVSGTLPPFDKHIVLAPERPKELVEHLRAALGLECLIVDANDLGKAEILAATKGVDQRAALEVLRRNPGGNGTQQTPILLLRRVDGGAGGGAGGGGREGAGASSRDGTRGGAGAARGGALHRRA